MGKARNFTPSVLDELAEGKHFDPSVAGLCVIVSGAGHKKWHFRRRVARSGLTISLTLGRFPAYSISQARKWAEELNVAIERGDDPRIEIRREKSRAATLADAHKRYMEVLRRGERKQLKPRTLQDKVNIFSRDIEPRLGRKILTQLTEDDCWDAVYDKAKSSKDRANKMAGELSCFLRWCSGREGQMAGLELKQHPAPTLNSHWFSTGPKANSRFLDDKEIGWLFQALADEPRQYRRGFILLLLTAARRNELIAAPASEFEDGVWRLPPERSKNGDANIVSLGPWGRHLVRTNEEWLFPSSRIEGPQLSGWFKVRDRIHSRMEELAKVRLASWHFHDLRRTFRSNARRVGIDQDIAELMINHRRKGIEGIYNKNQEFELRAAGFATWEAFLADIAIKRGISEELEVPISYVEADIAPK